jgi:hypothetical protein
MILEMVYLLSKNIIKYAKLADHNGDALTSKGERLYYKSRENYIIRYNKSDYG